jgi:acetyl esterase/lipase
MRSGQVPGRPAQGRLHRLPPGVALLLLLTGQPVNRVSAEEPRAVKKASRVEVIEDVAYYQGKDADPVKHKLDLYLPRGKKDFPVLFLVHGGSWRLGDKGHLGIFNLIGRHFARLGIGVVVPNYRLSPRVTHPAHVQDVARAFAWAHRHIQRYGGRPEEIFACGHSAGGHLVALLGTDPTYLKAEGLTLKAIKGVIPLCGVFQIPDGSRFTWAFGKDQAVRRQASPICHARPDAPPFLVLFAEVDVPLCGKAGALAFCQALREKQCPVEPVEVKQRNHISLLFNLGSQGDPASRAILGFIHKQLLTAGGQVAAGHPAPKADRPRAKADGG